MNKQHFFGKAVWVGAKKRERNSFHVLRSHFKLEKPGSVRLHVLGLGFFKCYINGTLINPDTFLPLSSDYESTCDPAEEVLSGHRIYVPEFDITELVRKGDNVIAIHFGGGWYTFQNRTFGLPKAIFRISAETENGAVEFVSDESCLISKGFVTDYNFVKYEHQSLDLKNDLFSPDADESGFEKAVVTEQPESEYLTTDCPADTLIEKRRVKYVGKGELGRIYDCGENTAGYPVLSISAKADTSIRVNFFEEILDNGKLDMSHHHGQEFTVECTAGEYTVQPEFTWFGFRYFEVIGEAEPLCVKVVHANIKPASSFECDNEVLNYIYKTFMHTMLCNMHTGIPSDCPHLERRGYTGDGQLTCNAVLSVLDARRFYEKWAQDIADSQDSISGHVQYTAPYINSGGGPGGWGCAIVEVPYQLYRHYGDEAIIRKYYPNMLKYIDYLDAHSEFGLVTSDKKGAWCLGDWCGPIVLYPEKDISFHDQQIFLPAPMVNTYFKVKSLQKMAEIAKIIGKSEDVNKLLDKADEGKRALRAAYFNTFNESCFMNIQGANAFAVDLGIGSERTYANMVDYYKRLGHFDTGIFATDILVRTLFENGDAELALELLTSGGRQGYAGWMNSGATTFHEYWDSNRSRSHNHPMFGAPVAYFFEYLLGIKPKKGTYGYKSLVIKPFAVSKFTKMSGSMDIPAGTVSISYERSEQKLHFTVNLPCDTNAEFIYGDFSQELCAGENRLEFDI